MKRVVVMILLGIFSTQAMAKETVVLLHGLARTPRSMNKIARVLEKDGYRVINCGYPSRQAGIEELTDDLFKELGPQIEKAQTVHFVTHSMGGVILRQYLESHEISNLGRVVMLAPPGAGSEVADKLGRLKLYQWINGPAGNQLGTSADSVPLLLKVPAFELGVIAGDRSINPILSMLIPGPDDGKVSVARSRIEGMTDYRCLHVTHACMMRNSRVINQARHFLSYGRFEDK